MIVGTATINGRVLEVKVEQSKGSVRAKDLREYLAKSNLPMNKAVILDQGQATEDTQAKKRRSSSRSRDAAATG